MRSPTTGKRYGTARICRFWGLPRSSFYLKRRHALSEPPQEPRKRGPKPQLSDADLLAVITAVRTTTVSYRGIWEQLRRDHGIRVARKRVLRILQEHRLIVPRRKVQRHPHNELSTLPPDCQELAPEALPERPCGPSDNAFSGLRHQKVAWP